MWKARNKSYSTLQSLGGVYHQNAKVIFTFGLKKVCTCTGTEEELRNRNQAGLRGDAAKNGIQCHSLSNQMVSFRLHLKPSLGVNAALSPFFWAKIETKLTKKTEARSLKRWVAVISESKKLSLCIRQVSGERCLTNDALSSSSLANFDWLDCTCSVSWMLVESPFLTHPYLFTAVPRIWF